VTHWLHVVESREAYAAGVDHELSVSKLEQKIEAKINVPGGDIFCESCEPDMYAAIDSLVDKLDRQIIRHKEKVIEHRQNGAARNRATE